MTLKSCRILALATVAGAALSPLARAERYLVGYKTVYVIQAVDPHEEERYELDRAYAVSYDAIVDREEADLRMVDDLAARHPRDADLLDRMRDRIRGDVEEDVDAAARHRDEMLAGWYTAAPNVYEACPEMVAVYRRERPVSLVEVKFSKGHRNDTYVLREPYRAHRVEPVEGIVYGKRFDREKFRQVAFVSPEHGGHELHVRSGWGGPPVRQTIVKVPPTIIEPVKPKKKGKESPDENGSVIDPPVKPKVRHGDHDKAKGTDKETTSGSRDGGKKDKGDPADKVISKGGKKGNG